VRIAVLGASGFIGSKLVQELTSQGHNVTGYVTKVPRQNESKIAYEPISSLKGGHLSGKSYYDVSINLAARRSTLANPVAAAEVREFTFEIPKLFFSKTSGANTLVINTSTYIQNFEGVEGRTIDSYGSAKQELSDYLRDSSEILGFKTLDLFFFTIYGQGDRTNHLVPMLLDAAKDGKVISLSPGFQLMNLLHIDDVNQNILKCLNLDRTPSYQKYRFWEEEYFTVRDLVAIIEEVADVSIDCEWGARKYAGHEMLKIWNFPMIRFPEFEAKISIDEGIRKLWLDFLKN
jgi:CDP-paratose synthetase